MPRSSIKSIISAAMQNVWSPLGQILIDSEITLAAFFLREKATEQLVFCGKVLR